MYRLQEKYNKEVTQKLMKELGLSNVMKLPKIDKVVVNAGIGDFRDNKEHVDLFKEELAAITGQKPAERRARKSEAGFKIRQNDLVGLSVTLRGDRMWAFLDKLVSIAIPRTKDFRGLSIDAFDKAGNYSLGIREHTIFPEVNANITKGIRHLQVSIVIKNSEGKEQSKVLLRELGFPLKKEK